MTATIPGIIRGLIRDGYPATKALRSRTLIRVKVSCQIVSPFRIKHAALRAVCLRLSAHLAVIFYHKTERGIRFMKLIKQKMRSVRFSATTLPRSLKVSQRCGFPQGAHYHGGRYPGTSECRKRSYLHLGKR